MNQLRRLIAQNILVCAFIKNITLINTLRTKLQKQTNVLT